MPRIIPCKKCGKKIAFRKGLSGYCWADSPLRKRKIFRQCEVCGRSDFISLKNGVHCLKHTRQITKYGKIIHSRTDPNIFIDKDSFYEMIVFDKNNNPKDIIKISKEDKKEVEKHRWCMDSLGYANNIKIGRLHNFLLKAKGIDHINRDKKDNRRDNLRVVSQSINCRNSSLSKLNTSGHKGVSKTQNGKKWRAYIKIKDKQINLGSFINIFEAINARLQAEKELW